MPTITTNIDRAVSDLIAGKPVAIPTETVYGLAAVINQDDAIRAVFDIKKRPLNHPLIVHVSPDWDLNQIVEEIPEYAKKLIAHFWPGPLTMVFRCKPDVINPLITGNQPTIAIRSPAHPLALQLLNTLQVPVVAPSANPFGKVSPTTASHVADSFSDSDLTILDGGRCHVGIESTIIDVTDPQTYQILRHGLIDEKSISTLISTRCLPKVTSIKVPGKLDSHYQPQKNLYYFDNNDHLNHFCQKREGDVYVIARQKPSSVSDQHYDVLADQPDKAAFDLYYQLRCADESTAVCTAIELPPDTSEWLGVRERIIKAGFPYTNRP